jgi:hypothetical protein
MRRHRILIAALAAALLTVPAAGAAEPARLEFFVRGAWTPGATGPAYSHSYDPHPGYAIPGSFVRQTLQVDPLAGSGLLAGLTVFFGPRLGLRLSLGRDENPFGGLNTPVEMTYKYTYWFPGPGGFNYRDGFRNTATEWPETSGSLRRTTIGLEAVLRLPLTAALSLNLSGGPTLGFFSGELHSLAYTELTYERYGATFFGTYFVRLRLPSRTVLGFTAGAELSLRFDPHAALIVNGSYRSGSYAGTPEIMAAYDYNDVLKAPAAVMPRIAASIHPGSIELKPSPFVLGAGLALVF